MNTRQPSLSLDVFGTINTALAASQPELEVTDVARVLTVGSGIAQITGLHGFAAQANPLAGNANTIFGFS